MGFWADNFFAPGFWAPGFWAGGAGNTKKGGIVEQRVDYDGAIKRYQLRLSKIYAEDDETIIAIIAAFFSGLN